jgi:two-component system, sensor histidine kinase PdtaS
VITSLLALQAARVDDERLKAALDDSHDRVRAIATLHTTIYGSVNLASIDCGLYLKTIVEDLASFYVVDQTRIQLRTSLTEVDLSTDQALPLGLIVSELVSNALKHAFPGERRGTITVRFGYMAEPGSKAQPVDDVWCQLTVEDDGIGVEDPGDIGRGKSLGLHIVHLFTGQLHGRVLLTRRGSTLFSVQFPLRQGKYSSAGT